MWHVFPHGLESNLLVPVLLGVLVTVALTEAWGWDFVGVVVPGYLCAVAVVQPVVAVVVAIEAVATWAFARLIDRWATRVGFWYPVFGRDRFYFILVVSVLVRLGFEVLAPLGLASAGRVWPRLGDFQAEMFGIGLVLVPLTANRLWRAGLSSGLFQLGVEVAVVRGLLAGLVLFTNFSLSGFELSFDRLALAFFSSPLSQLALLLTAALASNFNRRFGWDSHGILVPALLALVVSSPVKLLATLVEAGFIAVSVRALVRLPRLRHANLEGARKVTLCFLVGFGLKIGIAAVVGARFPSYRATDLFGFGYLLPSLLADRVLSKSNLPLVIVPTLQTAALGMPLAAALGLLLVWLSPARVSSAAVVARRHYLTLPQAVAANASMFRTASAGDVSALARQLLRGEVTADTADGYELVVAPPTLGLVARPARVDREGPLGFVVVAPEEAAAEAAAALAMAQRAVLIVGATGSGAHTAAALLGGLAQVALPPVPASSLAGDVGWGGASLRAGFPHEEPSERYVAAPASDVLEEAVLRIERDRRDPRRLAASLRPLGLEVRRADDSALVLSGAGWPTIGLASLRGPTEERGPVTIAPHASEVGAADVALLAAARVGGDCVVSLDPSDESGARPASELGVALARAVGAPLLVIRGTDFADHGDQWLVSEPSLAGARPAWFEGLSRLLTERFTPARPSVAERAALRAFPTGTSATKGAALLWLSSRARRALAAGQGPFGRPDYVELARRSHVPVVHEPIAAWLRGASAAPDEETLQATERLAQTADPAMLTAIAAQRRLALVLDDERNVAGLGVLSTRGRAIVIGGDRREARVVVRSADDVAAALDRGARTLVAGAAP